MLYITHKFKGLAETESIYTVAQLSIAKGISFSKNGNDFFQNKKMFKDFEVFFLKTKPFMPKEYEILWNELPLGLNPSSKILCLLLYTFFVRKWFHKKQY